MVYLYALLDVDNHINFLSHKTDVEAYIMLIHLT